MCGIVGCVTSAGTCAYEALSMLAHRGPDGEGSRRNGTVWLGHRRLSIVDLSADGAQPMEKPGCGSIVFNGEIYDHSQHRRDLEASGVRFDSRSDTEVLLRGLVHHGPGFLSRLHGMYAFAWLEPAGKRIWLGRDPSGMKPLWLWQGQEGMAFSSEVRSLARAVSTLGGTPRASARSVAGFLAYGSIQEPDCLLSGAQAVPAGSLMAIDVHETGRRTVVPIQSNPPVAVEGDPVVAVTRAMRNSVARHLVADLPVALFLSGGLDSAVLAAEMGRLHQGSTAISVVLGTAGTSDETGIVERHARRHSLRLHVVRAGDWSRRIGAAMGAYDQPSVDGINTFLVAGIAKDLGFKVALSGVGADEVFGGYGSLRTDYRLIARLRQVPFGRSIGQLLARGKQVPLRRLGLLMQGSARGENLQRARRRVFADDLIQGLVGTMPAIAKDLPDDPLLLEQQTYLRDTLLRDTDVMGMAHGVEIRAPYLDPEVRSVAAGIGSAALLDRRRKPKWPLRDGWRDSLEPEALRRVKTGFTLDLAGWLRTDGTGILEEARDSVRAMASDPAVAARAWTDALAEVEGSHASAWVRAFALIQLGAQFRRWGALE